MERIWIAVYTETERLEELKALLTANGFDFDATPEPCKEEES